MAASMRVWRKRLAVLVALQVVAALPLFRAALASIEPHRRTETRYVPLGSFRREVELGFPDRVRKLHVSIVLLIEGVEATDTAKRAVAYGPRLRDAIRAKLARVDSLDLGTLRGRENLKRELAHAVAGVLETDEVKEVLFDRYSLE